MRSLFPTDDHSALFSGDADRSSALHAVSLRRLVCLRWLRFWLGTNFGESWSCFSCFQRHGQVRTFHLHVLLFSPQFTLQTLTADRDWTTLVGFSYLSASSASQNIQQLRD